MVSVPCDTANNRAPISTYLTDDLAEQGHQLSDNLSLDNGR